MSARVTIVQGGGVGFDQVASVKRILAAAGAEIIWDDHFAGLAAMENGLPPLPEAMLQSVRSNRLALKTKLLIPPRSKQANYHSEFRKTLGLFAAVRPIKNLPGLPARFQNVNFLVLRELTEDLYTAIEHEIVPGVVQSLKIVTEAASKRFFHFAFQWTQSAGRKSIHCVHKANILKLGDGLFLEAFREVAKSYPEIQAKEIIVDNCCMQMVSKPQQFEVLAMGNLFGDIVSDLGAGLVGGISATAGINVGEGIKVYETFHGGRHDQIGPNQATPLPLLLPAMDLLEDIGQKPVSVRILHAVEKVLGEGKIKSIDLGGKSTTSEITDAIVAKLNG
jgi:isocitrate dehydrogenase (NAD+)